MQITHIKSRFLLGDNQNRLEHALMQLHISNQEITQVINNMGAYSLLGVLLTLFIPLKVYTIISKPMQ